MTESKKVYRPNLDEATGLGLIAAGTTPGGLHEILDHQERTGQTSLVHSTQLPVEGSPGHAATGADPHRDDAAWAATGIEFGPVVEGEIFRDVTLPDGWTKASTDHAMWSDLLDANGRRRATIFYKAAFYDQSASIGLVPRFSVRRNMDGVLEAQNQGHAVPMQIQVLDGRDPIWSSEVEHLDAYPRNGTSKDRVAWWDDAEAVEQRHRELAIAWLETRYPDFRDLTAHWDEPVAAPSP